jgi:phenylacetate-CoA ligase
MAHKASTRLVNISRLPGAVRVVLHLLIGVLALALVIMARATIARWPRGMAILGRFGVPLAERAGPVAAILTAARTRRTVPACRQVAQGIHPWRSVFGAGGLGGYLEAFPVLDKASYVDKYSLSERCRGGQLPATKVEVDESSGSSGRPYQWVRSRAELDQVERSLAVQASYLLRTRTHDRVVVLNCFSMGAWATGSSVTGALRQIGVIKSCGPDAEKALAAIELLGPDACYVICGYPPFLTAFLDAATARSIDLSGYELWGFVGGEGMTEALRGRLQRVFHRVLSAYGASDLDIGVAGETELAVALRQAAAADPALAQALFGRTGRLPMIFQYDPSTYFVETIGSELVVTVVRKLLSPRVRYAVHDTGGTLTFRAAVAIAEAHGIELPTTGAARLPFLYVAGRADATLSHMGANLYPEDVDAALAALAEQYPDFGLGSFCLELAESADGSTKPRIHVEAHETAIADQIRTGIAEWLVSHNRDWTAAAAEDRRAPVFDICVTNPGSGVFTDNATRIKRRYVLS